MISICTFLVFNVAFLKLKGSPTEENEDDSFLHIDSNNDKVITREEMTEYLKKMESSKESDPPTDPEEIKKEHETLIKEIFETKGKIASDFLTIHFVLELTPLQLNTKDHKKI